MEGFKWLYNRQLCRHNRFFFQTNFANAALATIVSIQPKESSGGAGETRESVVFRMADEMLEKLPANFLPHEVNENRFFFRFSSWGYIFWFVKNTTQFEMKLGLSSQISSCEARIVRRLKKPFYLSWLETAIRTTWFPCCCSLSVYSHLNALFLVPDLLAPGLRCRFFKTTALQ